MTSWGLSSLPAESLILATRYQVWGLENILEKGQILKDRDKIYVPRQSRMTRQLDLHDLVVAVPSVGKGKVPVVDSQKAIFVNSLFSCLATLSDRYSFTFLWKPQFISKLAPEDRCHLNGLAVVEGKPAYVTACGPSDVTDLWRDQRRNGGCLMDVESNEIVSSGLSMPHSPRFYRERLWLLNSGAGEFGYIDLATGKFEGVTFCGGYLRGLAFWGDYAIVGLSKPREQTFSGLVLQDRLAAKKTEAFCGLQVIYLKTGDILHWLRVEGIITELYDVAVLPGVLYPGCIGLQKTEELRRIVRSDRSVDL